MKILFEKFFVILIINFLLTPKLSVGQSYNTISKLQIIVDSGQCNYSCNDLLINGQVYYQPNRMASGTPFIFSSTFNKGTIFTRGLSYDVLGLNYNIVDKELILLHKMSSGAMLHIKLSNILVDSFLLNNYLFIAPKILNININYTYMLAANNDYYRILIGFRKEFINRYTQSNPYGKFGSTKKLLFLVHDTIVIKINSKKTLLKTATSGKKEISAFLKRHKIKLLKATPNQLNQLMDFYNRQMNSTHE